jgi:hypothetical protein
VGSEREEDEGRGLKEISTFNFSNFENAASNDIVHDAHRPTIDNGSGHFCVV